MKSDDCGLFNGNNNHHHRHRRNNKIKLLLLIITIISLLQTKIVFGDVLTFYLIITYLYFVLTFRHVAV